MSKTVLTLLTIFGIIVGSIVGGYVGKFGSASSTLAQDESLLFLDVVDFTSTTEGCVSITDVGPVCYSNREFLLGGVPIHYDYVKNIKLYAFDGSHVIFLVKDSDVIQAQSILGGGEPSSATSLWYKDSSLTTTIERIETQIETSTPNAYGVTSFGRTNDLIDLAYGTDIDGWGCDVKITQSLITPSDKVANSKESIYGDGWLVNGVLTDIPPNIITNYGFNSVGDYDLQGIKTWRCECTYLSGCGQGGSKGDVKYAWTPDFRIIPNTIYIVDLPSAPSISRISVSNSNIQCSGSFVVEADVQESDDVSIVINGQVVNGVWSGQIVKATIYHDMLNEGISNKIYVSAFNVVGNAHAEVDVYAQKCVAPITTNPPQTTPSPITTTAPPTTTPEPTDTPSPTDAPIDCSQKTICLQKNVAGGEYYMKLDEETQECIPDFLNPTGDICYKEGLGDETNTMMFLLGLVGTIGVGLGIYYIKQR